jgi:Zn-dependent peptidase ImmA (M78 family)/transcriptional regulator with XRE-family HTH domain
MDAVRLQSWEEVGARVALARERAGFTQQRLGDQLGLHRTAVTRIELGQRQLDALELSQIAEALGRSVEWFLTEPPPAIASHRDGVSDDADVLRLEEQLENVGRDVELLIDVGTLSMPAAGLPSGISSLDDAESGAHAARVMLGVETGPLIDLQAVVERVGLLAFSFDLGPSIIDGGYVRVANVGVALVNGTSDAGRRRFTLAHELGHHLMADEYTPDFGLGSTRSERESLINAFAIHLLIPRASVVARWEELAREGDDIRRRLIQIAAEYQVSWSAAISHAATLQLISRDEFGLLEVRRPTPADYFELGIRFDTELEPVTLPFAFSQAAIRAYRRGVISADRVVQMMRGTLTEDDLPRPHEIPIDALAAEFQDMT